LLLLDQPALQALQIVLPFIAANVEYANTRNKKSPQTQDLSQNLFKDKVSELVSVIDELVAMHGELI
jgi:hypothetical protein